MASYRQAAVSRSIACSCKRIRAAILKAVTAKRLTDFAAYVVIGLAVGLILITVAAYDIDFKWVALFFETVLVFGCVLAFHKRKWKFPAFWLLCAVALIVHLGLLIPLLFLVAKIRAFWVSGVFVVETPILIELIDRFLPWLFGRKTGVHHRRSHDGSFRRDEG
jgi:hypothetical protein